MLKSKGIACMHVHLAGRLNIRLVIDKTHIHIYSETNISKFIRKNLAYMISALVSAARGKHPVAFGLMYLKFSTSRIFSFLGTKMSALNW